MAAAADEKRAREQHHVAHQPYLLSAGSKSTRTVSKGQRAAGAVVAHFPIRCAADKIAAMRALACVAVVCVSWLPPVARAPRAAAPAAAGQARTGRSRARNPRPH